MKKKLTVLALALALLLVFTGCCSHEWNAATCETPKTCAKCSETEGEALGHSWVDATCAAPKTCSVCNKTEGEALGHSWVDATTEAPKTCSVCAATEGERIITDERFTTAATAAIQGKWIAEDYMPASGFELSGFETDLKFTVTYVFGNDGSMTAEYIPVNEEEFSTAMADWIVANVITNMAQTGYSEEATRQQFQDAYGMTLEEYATSTIASMDLTSMLSDLNESNVYYVEGDQIYNAGTWSSTMGSTTFTLEGDTLTLSGQLGSELNGDLVCKRAG